MSVDSPEDRFGKTSRFMNRLASTHVVMRSSSGLSARRLANDRPTLVRTNTSGSETAGGGLHSSGLDSASSDIPFGANFRQSENTRTNQPDKTVSDVVDGEVISTTPISSEPSIPNPANTVENSPENVSEEERNWLQRFAGYVDLIWEKTRYNPALGVLAMGVSGVGTYLGLDLLNANPQFALFVGLSSMLSTIAIGFLEDKRFALNLEREMMYHPNAQKWMRRFAKTRILSNSSRTLWSVAAHPITIGAAVGAATYGAIHINDDINSLLKDRGSVHGREMTQPDQLPETHTSPVNPPGSDVTPETIKIEPGNEPPTVDWTPPVETTPPFTTGPGTEIPWNHELAFVKAIPDIQNPMAATNLLKNVWHGIEQTGTDWSYLNRLDAREAVLRLEGILRMATKDPSSIDSLKGTDSLLYQLGSVGRAATPEEVQQIIQTFPMP